MAVILVTIRHGNECRFTYNSLEEAAKEAVSELENDISFPKMIVKVKDDEILWKFDNWKSLSILRGLANDGNSE